MRLLLFVDTTDVTLCPTDCNEELTDSGEADDG